MWDWESTGSNTPSPRAEMCLRSERAIYCWRLKVTVSHFFVVPWRVVLGEVVGKVQFSWCPFQIKLFLLNAIFQPPISHVKCFGKFLSHCFRKDSIGCFVVGVERGAGFGLLMSKFFEGSNYWASLHCSEVDAGGFGFSGRTNNITDCLT
jgi:hypothetical protein